MRRRQESKGRGCLVSAYIEKKRSPKADLKKQKRKGQKVTARALTRTGSQSQPSNSSSATQNRVALNAG
ncbi:hypothetical protein SLA2020_105690 [Shorea laevis]